LTKLLHLQRSWSVDALRLMSGGDGLGRVIVHWMLHGSPVVDKE